MSLDQIYDLVKKSPITSISLSSLFVIVGLIFMLEDRYVKAEALQDFKSKIEYSVIQNRIKYLKDEIFILKFKEKDPNENKDLNRALQDRYKQELMQLERKR